MDQDQLRQPRRVVARALVLGIGSLVAAAMLTWSPAIVSGWNQGSAEATVWQLVNGSRVNNGRAPLQQHSTLVSLARWRSSDMLAKSYFSHTIAGCGCLVYAYYDSNGLSYDWAGENIGWNSGLEDSYSPVRVHEAFMESPGHRANVLDPSFTHGGVGAAAADNKPFLGHTQNTRMYTELFMEATGAAPAPQPAPPTPPPGSGGGGGGGGGSTAPAPAQPVATPAPTAQRATMEAPRRPTSSAGLDGVSTLVTDPDRLAALARWRTAEIATDPVAAAAEAADEPTADTGAKGIEVAAASGPEGPLEGIVGAILGFLFG